MEKEFIVWSDNTPSRNGRIYPKDVMQSAVESLAKKIEKREVFRTLIDESAHIIGPAFLVTEGKLADDKFLVKVSTTTGCRAGVNWNER